MHISARGRPGGDHAENTSGGAKVLEAIGAGNIDNIQ